MLIEAVFTEQTQNHPQPPLPSTPVLLVSAPLHCSIELFYYEIPFGMEAWWLLILSGDLKLHHFNINLSSHLRTFFSSFIISLIVSRCTPVYHNDVVVVDLWTTLNSSMYQNSFIGVFFYKFLAILGAQFRKESSL